VRDPHAGKYGELTPSRQRGGGGLQPPPYPLIGSFHHHSTGSASMAATSPPRRFTRGYSLSAPSGRRTASNPAPAHAARRPIGLAKHEQTLRNPKSPQPQLFDSPAQASPIIPRFGWISLKCNEGKRLWQSRRAGFPWPDDPNGTPRARLAMPGRLGKLFPCQGVSWYTKLERRVAARLQLWTCDAESSRFPEIFEKQCKPEHVEAA
jgi:hypothetical protein